VPNFPPQGQPDPGKDDANEAPGPDLGTQDTPGEDAGGVDKLPAAGDTADSNVNFLTYPTPGRIVMFVVPPKGSGAHLIYRGPLRRGPHFHGGMMKLTVLLGLFLLGFVLGFKYAQRELYKPEVLQAYMDSKKPTWTEIHRLRGRAAWADSADCLLAGDPRLTPYQAARAESVSNFMVATGWIKLWRGEDPTIFNAGWRTR